MRPLLFRVPADRGHALAHHALRWTAPWRLLARLQRLEPGDAGLRTRFAGVSLPNPVGLAAGFDKDGDLVEALSHLGFGFLTVGTIMPGARPGNPFPRLVRYPERRSLADSMGLPGKGCAYAVERLRGAARRVPVFANVGGFSADEIAGCARAVEPWVDGIEVSLMCPNTVHPEDFDPVDLLRQVLERVDARRKPLVVRVPNGIPEQAGRLAELVERCIEAGVGGLKVGGGRPVVEPRLGSGKGTLHGRDIFEGALANVERAASIARGRIDIKGNGGLFTADDVAAMLRAGACCVDLYSAFIYEGWGVAARINSGLRQR